MRKKISRIFNAARGPIFIGAIFLFCLFLVAQKVYLIKLGDKVTIMRSELRTLKDSNEAIEFEISKLLDTKRLETIAKEDFGLRAARLDEVVTIAEPHHDEGVVNENAIVKFAGVARKTLNALIAASFGEKGFDDGSI